MDDTYSWTNKFYNSTFNGSCVVCF